MRQKVNYWTGRICTLIVVGYTLSIIVACGLKAAGLK